MSQKKPLDFDPDKYLYAGCIPLKACPEHPKDQSPCIIQDCEHCSQKMWVSEKKRKLLAANPDKIRIYCLDCLLIGAHASGFAPEIMDIAKL